jgi:hypothetical protein
MAMPSTLSTQTRKQEQVDRSHQEADTLLTMIEFARRLWVETTTVRRWIATGIRDAVILPHHGKRQSCRIQQHTLDQLLRSPL